METNRKYFVIFLILILIAGGVGAYFWLNRDDGSSTEQASQTDQQTEITQLGPQDDFSTIIYAHSEKLSGARELFTKAVNDGIETQPGHDLGIASVVRSDYEGEDYVVVADRKVYVGSGTNQPRLAYSATGEVTTVKIDGGSQSAVVGEMLLQPEENTYEHIITVVYLNGADSETFYEAEGSTGLAIFPEDWDGDNQVLYARRSCIQCDGYNPDLVKIDANSTESTIISPGPTFHTVTGYTFTNDSDKALFVNTTSYEPEGLIKYRISNTVGALDAAPFTLMELNLATGKTIEVTEFGSTVDVKSDGFFDAPVVAWADTKNGPRRAYSYLTKLFVENNRGSFDTYFETIQKTISTIYAVDANELLIGEPIDDGERITYYNIDEKDGATIMHPLDTTTVLGITKQ